jgi:hypothetical protein
MNTPRNNWFSQVVNDYCRYLFSIPSCPLVIQTGVVVMTLLGSSYKLQGNLLQLTVDCGSTLGLPYNFRTDSTSHPLRSLCVYMEVGTQHDLLHVSCLFQCINVFSPYCCKFLGDSKSKSLALCLLVERKKKCFAASLICEVVSPANDTAWGYIHHLDWYHLGEFYLHTQEYLKCSNSLRKGRNH